VEGQGGGERNKFCRESPGGGNACGGGISTPRKKTTTEKEEREGGKPRGKERFCEGGRKKPSLSTTENTAIPEKAPYSTKGKLGGMKYSTRKQPTMKFQAGITQ